MEDRDALATRIGRNLKALRTESGLVQKDLAEATQLSPTLISRIENGLVRPSIATLELIARSLKVDIGFFFRDEEKKQFEISRRGRRKILPSERGYDIELLIENMENLFMEPVIVSLKPKEEEHNIESATHEGQEFMYVLEGKIEMIIGSKRFVLERGDAAYWIGTVPHKAVSLTAKPAKTLNVHFIPGTRTGTFGMKDRNATPAAGKTAPKT